MNPRNSLAALAMALFLLGSRAGLAAPLGTAFTYQGQIEQSGQALDGTADVLFTLFDAATAGTQIGAPQQLNGITVERGLFTANINFGATVFNGDARWLEVAVRSPSGVGVFTTLTPRQSVNATPYALQTRGIHVNSVSNVGIGTSTPAKKLTVAGDMEIGTNSGDYRHLRIGGGNCSGFLYGSYPAWGDGIHMGYNYYADASGTHRIIASDGQTSRLSLGYGYAALATGGINQVPINRLTVSSAGNVGLGTDNPSAKLDVRGNVKLGPTGQYFAPAGEENLRMIRGIVDGAGNILQGTGFTATRLLVGLFKITFNVAFVGIPTVTATARAGTPSRFAQSWVDGPTEAYVYINDHSGNSIDGIFHFCAMGPR